MEALWKIEDKWKLSTEKALILFVCTVVSVIGLCATAMLKKKRVRVRVEGKEQEEGGAAADEVIVMDNWSESSSSGGSMIRKALMGNARWSGASKWEAEDTHSYSNYENGNGNNAVAAPRIPLQLQLQLTSSITKEELGWQRRNLGEAVWQRRILMGERCELPRFSGLILYDEQGRPLHHSSHQSINVGQEKIVTTVTTLRDLL